MDRRVLLKGVAFIVISIGALALGAELTVSSAVDLATQLGVSTLVIGITVVSVGTVLPELTVSIIAAREKQQDIAIGNLLGTLIFNTLVVAGTAAAISGCGLRPVRRVLWAGNDIRPAGGGVGRVALPGSDIEGRGSGAAGRLRRLLPGHRGIGLISPS